MIRDFFRLLGSDGKVFRGLVITLVAAAIIQAVAFVLLVPLTGSLLGGDIAAATSWFLIEVVLFAAYAALIYRVKISALATSNAVAIGLWQRLGDHIATLPLGWFDRRRVGEVSKTVASGVFEIMSVPANMLRPLIDTFVTPPVVILGLFAFQWRLALIALAMAPVLFVAYRLAGRLLLRTDERTHQAAIDLANRLVEFAQAQPVLRAFGGRGERLRLLDAALKEQHDANARTVGVMTVAQFGFGVVVQAGFTVLILSGIALMLGTAIGPTELVALLILATRFVQPLMDAGEMSGGVRMMRNTIARIERVLDTQALPSADGSVAVGEPSVELQSAGFGYEAGKPVLTDVSFTAAPRTITALVGPSGSGKTTVTRLIGRFWDVDSGRILVGGADVRELPPETLMKQLSFVFQDVWLFSGTIRENILLARPDATPEALDEALRLARVDEILARLPQGLDTEVGDGGTALSGGERQRVSIARAILKDAPIVLLDEATAALDPENEALVQDALGALARDRTLIVIAHRLQTIMAADQILVLDQGRIIEAGTHAELIAAGGKYTSFWRERQRSQGWRIAAKTVRSSAVEGV